MSSVLFIAPSAYLYGGLASWLDYLVPGLESKGWDVTVGLPQGRWHNADAYSEKYPFNKWIPIKCKTGNREGRIRALYKAIKENNPDIVAGINIPDTYAAVERLRMKGKDSPRAVMTLHGFLPQLFEDMKNFSGVLDGVICTNKLACALSEKYSVMEKSRVHYAPYGVKVLDKKQKDKKSGPLKILYVGRLEEDFQKRVTEIPLIVDALEKKDLNYEFKIAGSGELENKLKERLSNNAFKNKVIFLGALFGEDLSRAYEWADALLMTSFWETGPIVAWEAMARGVTVVSSAYIGSGLEGSLKDGENCLLFPIGDIGKAADCLMKAKDLNLREKFSENGYNLILEKYTREVSASLWDKAFREVLSSEKRSLPGSAAKTEPAGRLDRIFGVSIAENIREFFHLSFNHSSPGGEWPHSYGRKNYDDKEFWDLAKGLDKGTEPQK